MKKFTYRNVRNVVQASPIVLILSGSPYLLYVFLTDYSIDIQYLDGSVGIIPWYLRLLCILGTIFFSILLFVLLGQVFVRRVHVLPNGGMELIDWKGKARRLSPSELRASKVIGSGGDYTIKWTAGKYRFTDWINDYPDLVTRMCESGMDLSMARDLPNTAAAPS
ncbi:MAG: hypothetical protein JSS72_04280 [Armatimonadetes bacterium]|nr:hypothetical protein [Armatimonadota bacterium]